jgi:FkbM family methyltransferase
MHPLNRLLAPFSLQLRRVPQPGAPWKSDQLVILEHFGIDQIIDVGAHVGHSAAELFRQGYLGSVISFEPVQKHYDLLAEAVKAGQDQGWRWTARQEALGDRAGSATIHVAGNGQSSSLAAMLEEHVRLNPDSAYIQDEEVRVVMLDDLAEELVTPHKRTLVQLDVQGLERQVLAGAAQTLPKLAAVQLEVSLRPVYQGGLSVMDAFSLMEKANFVPVYVQPAWMDPISRVFYQLDVLWLRGDLVTTLSDV